MLRIHPVALAVAVFVVASAARTQTFFVPPTDPAGNPTTPQKALLGKALFWDEQLSASRTVACGTCHVFGHGGGDPRSVNVTHPGRDGVFGTADDIHGSSGVVRQDVAGVYSPSALFGIRPQSTGRRAPSPINAAYEFSLFWDGRAGNSFADPVTNAVLLTSDAALESQAAGPPASDVEMSHLGRSWTDVANDMQNRTPLALAENVPAALSAFVAGQTYAMLFQQVYGSPGVTPSRIVFAIAAYERTLIADQTPYDAFLANTGTLTASEHAGFSTFTQFCMICHIDTLPGMQSYGPGTGSFFTIGVRPPNEDVGRYAVTQVPFDMGAFKTPQLRNVALRAPYMHNGSLATLGDVIDFYNRGGDFGPNIDINVQQIASQLTPQMKADLIAFLQTLTDPRVAQELPPFDRPRLWSESNRVPTTFGIGSAGTNGLVPTNQVTPPPYLGNGKFMLAMDRALASAPTFLLLDLASSPTPTPILGQNLYLTPGASVLFTGLAVTGPGGDGYATHALPIPPTPFLAGLSIYGQWLVIDPAGPSGLASSNAFGLTLF
jgi:cytochrome c peroxidase